MSVLESLFLVDIDETVAVRPTAPDVRGPFDWHRVGEDHPNWPVITGVRALHTAGHRITLAVLEALELQLRGGPPCSPLLSAATRWPSKSVRPHPELWPVTKGRPDRVEHAKRRDPSASYEPDISSRRASVSSRSGASTNATSRGAGR
ncbi:hypothetical protein [Actinomadura sp. 9N215]|uniref:phosphatase domain-containing protein n=1 Tax=Actinomadura sp. 9N215 TaxID=3375150 RepID=UPI003797E255